MNILLYSVWLQQRLGRGSAHALPLLRKWRNARALYEAETAALAESGIGGTLLAALSDKSTDAAERVLRDMERYGVWAMTPDDPHYPASLCALADLPVVLYGQGDFPDDWDERLTFAVVGTRRESSEDARLTAGMTAGLLSCDVTVVTGAATGADASVLEAACRANGSAVSVLACGHAVGYPRATEELRARLLQSGGVLLSEHPPRDRGGDRGTYPVRNRLLSGLTVGTVIASAPAKSGALMTARAAREQGRDVFAVPGDARTHAGCHALIQDGATLVTGCADILREYTHRLGKDQSIERAAYIEQNWSGAKAQTASPPVREKREPSAAPLWERPMCPQGLSQQATAVFGVLGEQAMPLDEIANRTGIPSSCLLGVMTELELTGVVQTHVGGQYRLKG